MRILAIHPNATIKGGGDAVYVHETRLLARRGHQVAWLTIGQALEAAEAGQPAFCVPEFRDGAAWKKQAGLTLGHLYHPTAYRMAKRALQEFMPDLIRAHNIQGHLSPAVLLPFREKNIPIVQTLHDYRLLCPAIHFLSHGQVCEACKGKKYVQCIRKRCRQGQLIRSAVAAFGSWVSDYIYQYDRLITAYIAPGEFLRQKMIEYGYNPAKIYHLPNAYWGEPPEAVAEERHHLLFVGRLSYEKGVDLLIRAVAKLDMPTLIAGDGPERDNLKLLADEIGARNVRFLGYQNSAALSQLYRTALVTVMPSRWYENGPLVLLESYAHATPVVGARIGAIPEFVEEGQSGYLFKPNDADDLQRVLQDCIHSPEKLNHMGANAAAWVRAGYSPDKYIIELERILTEQIH